MYMFTVVMFYRPKENPDVKIVAVDLQLMAPLDGVIQIHGDITKVTKTASHYTRLLYRTICSPVVL